MHEGQYGQAGSPGGEGRKGPRSYCQNAYHYCSRCGERNFLSEMIWQRGLLLCTKYDCYDYSSEPTVFPLIGQREAAINAAFEIPTDELKPDPKISDPNYSGSMIEDDVIY